MNKFLGALMVSIALTSPSFGFCLLDRMLGNGCGCCCEPSCSCCEKSCCCEQSCGCNSCGCNSCCGGGGCCILDRLCSCFHGSSCCGCCEKSCACDPSCGCSSCGCE